MCDEIKKSEEAKENEKGSLQSTRRETDCGARIRVDNMCGGRKAGKTGASENGILESKRSRGNKSEESKRKDNKSFAWK